MRKVSIVALAAVVLTMAVSPAMATFSCQEKVIPTKDDAPVNRTSYRNGGGGNNDDLRPGDTRLGNCATIAADSPLNRPNGYCEWARNLSSLAKSVTYTEVIKYVTFDGDVPDIYKHRYGIDVPANKWTPAFFLPLTKYKDGAC